MYEYANKNKNALMHNKQLTFDDYMDARMISDPLCLYDNCLESDGAIAVVITKLSLAKTLSIEPAIIHAYSQGMSKEHSLMTDYHGDNPMQSSSYVTSENLWEQSDFKPADVYIGRDYSLEREAFGKKPFVDTYKSDVRLNKKDSSIYVTNIDGPSKGH